MNLVGGRFILAPSTWPVSVGLWHRNMPCKGRSVHLWGPGNKEMERMPWGPISYSRTNLRWPNFLLLCPKLKVLPSPDSATGWWPSLEYGPLGAPKPTAHSFAQPFKYWHCWPMKGNFTGVQNLLCFEKTPETVTKLSKPPLTCVWNSETWPK